MLIAEEFLLLCLDDESGRKTLGGESLTPALGGALLVELALRERIGITAPDAGWSRRGRVLVSSQTPTDDPELDQLIAHLLQHENVKVKDLVSEMSGRRITKGLVDRLVARLIQAGVLREERSAVLRLRQWPTVDPAPEGAIRQRLQSALVDRTTPTEGTVALIALLLATNQLLKVVKPVADTWADKRAVKARAKQLSEGDWAATAVKAAIDEVNAVMVSTFAVAVGVSASG